MIFEYEKRRYITISGPSTGICSWCAFQLHTINHCVSTLRHASVPAYNCLEEGPCIEDTPEARAEFAARKLGG